MTKIGPGATNNRDANDQLANLGYITEQLWSAEPEATTDNSAENRDTPQ